MPDLVTILRNRPPRESAGPVAIRGFAYQTHAAIWYLLEALRTGQAVTLVHEFFEDFIIVDNPHDPKVVRAIQVKTSSGKGLSLSDICARKRTEEGAKGASIVAKHADSASKFLEQDLELVLCLNLPLRRRVTTTCLDSFWWRDRPDEEYEAVRRILSEEYCGCLALAYRRIASVEVIDMSLGNYGKVIKGLIVEIVASQGYSRTFDAEEFYSVIRTAFEQKFAYVDQNLTIETLLTEKSTSIDELRLFFERLRDQSNLEAAKKTLDREAIRVGLNSISQREHENALIAYHRSWSRGEREASQLYEAVRSKYDPSDLAKFDNYIDYARDMQQKHFGSSLYELMGIFFSLHEE